MKTALAILGIVLLIIGGVLFYESRSTVWTFEPTPLRIALPIVSGATVQKSFTPDLTEKYQVNLDFEKPVTPLTIGTFMKEMQTVDMAWSVSAGGKIVASGESASYPKNWYGAGAKQGWVIGEFPALKGTTYLLQAKVRSGPADLNSANPHIEVEVDASRLTDYSYGESFRLLLKSAGRMVASLGLLLLLVAAILARRGG
jgi:hypothetical protein